MSKLSLLLTLILLLATASVVQAQKNKNQFSQRYAADFAPGEVELQSSYLHVVTRTANGTYVRRTYFPETKQIISYVEYTDKKLSIGEGANNAWYDEGGIRTTGQSNNDKYSGEWRYYYPDGSLRTVGSYVTGYETGIWTEYFRNEQIRQTVTYVAGKKEGAAVRFDSSGVATDTLMYEAGETIEENAIFIALDNEQEVYKSVERMPLFPGCDNYSVYEERKKCADDNLLQWVYRNVRYPNRAVKMGVEGLAMISFVIERSGEVTELYVVRGLNEDIRDELYRLVGLMPRWESGMVDNEPVRVQFNLPVKFNLN